MLGRDQLPRVMPNCNTDTLYSQNYACPDCGISLEELEPRAFSFNNPYGACPTCTGLGSSFEWTRIWWCRTGG